MSLLQIGKADVIKVFDLTEHLRKAFEAFFEQNETLQPHDYSQVDILMAAHNFHKLVILSLAGEQEFSPEERRLWCQMAATTFTNSMNEAGRKQGGT